MMASSPVLAARTAQIRSRFIALLRPSAEAYPMLQDSFSISLREFGGLSCVLETGPVAVAAGHESAVAIGSHGMVIGDIYRKEDGSRVTRFADGEVARIVGSDLTHLIDCYWGAYVAVMHDPQTGQTRVLRAPLGESPCLIVPLGEAYVLASDVDIVRDFGFYDAQIDWSELALQLTRKDAVSTRTCLWSVRELRGGTMETFAPGGPSTTRKWSPLDALVQRRIETSEEAVALVSATTRMCVASRAARHRRVLLQLSGGIDSSIVAAALTGAGVSLEALALTTRDPLGDERDYARSVCDLLGIPLHERQRDVQEIDVMWSSAVGMPRPSGRYMWQESVRHSRDVAGEIHADAVFNGGGGDQVYCSLHSANPVADTLRAFGPGRCAVRMAACMSEITQVSVARIMRDAVARAWLGKRAPAATFDTSLMSARFEDHEIALPAAGASKYLPGQEAHSRLIMAGQSYVETLDPRSALPVVAPLLSQPLVEACLRIPSWLWFRGGLNRYPARQAFALDLPENVICRRSKGTPDSFTVEIFETWRAEIRELLADGELARQGIIDRAAVLDVLGDPHPPRDNRFRRVLQFAEAEAWAASWA